ncbi:copper amine oxidase N-terminal domain-containing protein [Anaerotignum propionicum]|uniref:copper amine oxidase N-terminal domain-containing protein n=1 Tax=Anaerotignum propionicum TaxID=28446 RepID=UPI00210ABFEC|nr:copper amine oxidase N-terminal domain-containing protein [Anaerotignum propionicum]MCQ4935478.1 copper amine oxidase N-terminal domain-containing protein [Anaerotignum propionicum]
MKKFISFVMAGAMVASLVPATAFAKGDVEATAKVIDALEKDKTFDGKINASTVSDIPELQLKVTSASYQQSTSTTPEMDVTVTLDNADFDKDKFDVSKNLGIRLDDSTTVDNNNTAVASAKKKLDDEKAAQALAQKDYDDAVKALPTVTVPKTTRLTAAEGNYKPGTTESGDAVDDLKDAKDAVETAKLAVKTAEELVASTYAAYLADSTKEAAWTAAKADLVVKQDAVAPLETAVQTAQTAYDKAKAEYEAAKAEYDKIIEDATAAKVKTQLDALNAAKDNTAKAQAAYDAAVAAAGTGNGVVTFKDVKFTDSDELEFTIVGKLSKDDVIFLDLVSIMDKTSEGKKATVSVDSKMVKVDDLTFASVLSKGLKVSIKKTVDVATDEVVTLNSNGLKIETSVGEFTKDQVIKLKLNSGFEFVKGHLGTAGTDADVSWVDDKEMELKITATGAGKDEITLKETQVEATTAKSGAVATITARSNNMDSASCEVAKVVDYKVSLTVDADEDVPVIYSGVDKENTGITDDSDHLSLEVTAKESFPGAWSMRQGFNFNLPEGVYVTDVKVNGADNFKIVRDGKKESEGANKSDWEAAFKTAYQDGDHKNFEFKKRVFNDVDTILEKDPAELTFQLELVADPTFEGDVKLAFEGALVDKQEVTIAKFVKPYTVKAEQNDVIIDYRNTDVKTPIVITEAEEGLWKKDTTFKFNIETGNITFEDDPTFTIDKDSDLKLKDDKADKGTVKFAVKEESDKAASVTISDMKLFMQRNIPAGAYDLEITTTMNEAYDRQVLFAPDADSVEKWTSGDRPSESKTKKDSYVDDVCDYSDVVKAAFINVVTSGRDNDNLFTTKVVVPVGEAYLLAGEAKVELDAPAYISAAGYTMLPVRAISKALGVNTNNVLWNAETRTVTVMYAQRIITMTVGQKTIYVNGSAIPSSAAPEIKDGRTFLPLRDLGTALGVTNVNWDAATKTATLN